MAFFVLAVVTLATTAAAHPLAPALLELDARADGTVGVRFKTSLMRPRGVELSPRLPDGCTRSEEVRTEVDDQSVSELWTEQCGSDGLVGREIAVDGLGPVRIDVLVRIALPDGRIVNTVLRADSPSLTVPAPQEKSQVLSAYSALGIEHILSGPDHLLFVLGLLLLVRHLRPLIKTITAFTLGHSVTLSLVALGIARVPSRLVELLIAVSVLILAIELAAPVEGRKSLLRRRPWLITCGFGLLHGMGFAGALAEIGLPQEEIPVALFAFNIGIELGQLAFVLAVSALFVVLRRPLAASPEWLMRVPAYGIGTFAAFWCYERAAALL